MDSNNYEHESKFKIGMILRRKKSHEICEVISVTDKSIKIRYNIDVYDAGYEKTHLIRNIIKYDMFEIIANSYDEYEINRNNRQNSDDKSLLAQEKLTQLRKKENLEKKIFAILFGLIFSAMSLKSSYVSYNETGEIDLGKAIIDGFAGVVQVSMIGFFTMALIGLLGYIFGIIGYVLFSSIAENVPGKNKKSNAAILITLLILILVIFLGWEKAVAVIVGLFVGISIAATIAGFISKLFGKSIGTKTFLILLPIAIWIGITAAYKEGILYAIVLMLGR